MASGLWAVLVLGLSIYVVAAQDTTSSVSGSFWALERQVQLEGLSAGSWWSLTLYDDNAPAFTSFSSFRYETSTHAEGCLRLYMSQAKQLIYFDVFQHQKQEDNSTFFFWKLRGGNTEYEENAVNYKLFCHGWYSDNFFVSEPMAWEEANLFFKIGGATSVIQRRSDCPKRKWVSVRSFDENQRNDRAVGWTGDRNSTKLKFETLHLCTVQEEFQQCSDPHA